MWDGHYYIQVAQAKPAVFGVHGNAQNAEIAQLFPDVRRKQILLVNCSSFEWRDV